MAPRPPKQQPSSRSPSPPSTLKPKTEKSKIAKPKADKTKSEKAKIAKPKPDKKPEKESQKGGGEKVKPVTGEEAAELILAYLKAQNRPYSATEVSANLHGKVTKTVADKILKELGEKNRVGMHSTNQDRKGSQFVFWTLQDPGDAASPEELTAMDETIVSLRARIPDMKARVKVATAKLAAMRSEPTTTELLGIVEGLRRENRVKLQRLGGFKTGEVRGVSKEEMERVESEHRYWSGKRKARKEAFMALEDILLGGMTREEIWERAGIEGDGD